MLVRRYFAYVTEVSRVCTIFVGDSCDSWVRLWVRPKRCSGVPIDQTITPVGAGHVYGIAGGLNVTASRRLRTDWR
jgi:hypothetical protein